MSTAESFPVGIRLEECQIIAQEAEAVFITEQLLAESIDSNDDPIEWHANPESDGTYVGKVTHWSGSTVGTVVYNGPEMPARLSSAAALRQETVAQAALQSAAAFAGSVALGSLEWQVPSQTLATGSQTGVGIAPITSADAAVSLLTRVHATAEGYRPEKLDALLCYTPQELAAFLLGAVADEFEFESGRFTNRVLRARTTVVSYPMSSYGSDADRLHFGGVRYDPSEDSLYFDLNEPLAQRWANRATTSGFYTAHGDMVRTSFESSHTSQAVAIDKAALAA
jgi:hypothetical protein